MTRRIVLAPLRAIAAVLAGRRRLLFRSAAVSTAALAVMALWLRLGPIDPGLLDLGNATSTVVVDRRGVPLYEALSGDGTRSVRLDADALPDTLVHATLAAEDRRFWSHAGVDPIAMLRALRRNIAEREIVEGGSTISQQVAKLLMSRADPQRTRGWRAKVSEAILALRLEHRYPKREILAMYLNLAAYGNQIVGAGRASRAYFGCDPGMLTVAQSAFLAGLPQRPTGFNPYRKFDAALARQRLVLRRMEAAGLASPERIREARDERLALVSSSTPFLAPHFVEMVLAAAGPRPPARIHTTIDAALQQDIAGIIRTQRPSLDRHGAANVAVVVLDNLTGEWLAWEGSGNYFDAARGGAINGPLTPRQPGSALKPFTYALAFEEGQTPAAVLADVPSHFPTAEAGVLYSPRNYDGRYRGPLLARAALAGSENVPAVALASHLGVARLLRFLNRAGLSTLDRSASHYGLGLTLGNAEVRLDELVTAYAAFARGGELVTPTWLQRDDTAAVAPERRRRLVSPLTAYWITDILADAQAREYIFGRGGSLELPFPTAVKTGTSQAYHDNWTVGYTRRVTVGVWVGNFDRSPLRHSSGVTGAGPIFHAVMLAAARRTATSAAMPDSAPIVPRPDGVHAHRICTLSGMTANAWCPSTTREWMAAPAGAATLFCSWHHRTDDGVAVFWPAEFRQWARQQGLLREPKVAAVTPTAAVPAVRSQPQPASAALAIANPPSGATFLIDPTLRPEFQALPLRVTTSRPGPIAWHVNGRPVGSSPSERALMWRLAVGVHRISASDAQGRTAEATIIVR